ncbi:Na/Pi cotransporter family protein [Lachnoclostridium phytofermentans]|uniref:Na/Pi-cotransporter II-related protein n=1 Tax=Lachnoclostridium phytofermentans (strain ATCC 700394 / DSM 18823 / ISDg) TaxID=357809 RepID=A9KP15_LACP7|nr:Na/Pi cotransporter family protein [Lachnoclostridium phytofermentans]ABX43185.1 Na/Pi-cotransporter II-related protein [Lachnoclostridium phytofermentans ISDg]
MDIFSLFTLLGGLAFFLYGMNVMGVGLDKVAGGRLERLLEKLTSSPIKSVALGTFVTAIIQSSSATTVMVVGFVNSGIMNLRQAIGVIMGANLGTTATAWILSLAGLQGDSFFVKLLKPSSFAPILAIIGIFLIMVAKKEKKKDVGSIMIGFALLMFGMDVMSGAVKPLADVPEFKNILTMFSNPILGVLTGAIFTAVIQSSSASVGILQALSMTGGITFGSAIPIIMGQNIGTCITAILSSIGAKKNAKRAALVHLYFNLIGTIIFLIVFYSIQYTIGFSFINNSVDAMSIAIVHTTFNLLTTAILLPFARGLEKLACMTLKDDKDTTNTEDTINGLDERFLASPGYAVDQCSEVTKQMAELAKDTILSSIHLLTKYDDKISASIMDNENRVDKYEDVLGTYLVKLSSKELSLSNSNSVSMFLHSIGDLERISDHAVNILDLAKEINQKSINFSKDAQDGLNVMTNAVIDILNMTIKAFVTDDLELAKQIEPLEEVIDLLRKELKDRHIRRLQKGQCTTELGFVYTDILTNFERVSDHCSNIAVSMLQLNENSFDTHEYLHDVKFKGERYFTEQFEANKKIYALPEVNE